MLPTQNDAELKNLHANVFQGATSRIPLIVSPPCPDAPTVDQLWEDLPAAVAKTGAALQDKREIGSDWIPSLNIGLYQCIAIPSLFGAEPVKLDGSEPICHPCFLSVAEAVAAGVPEIAGAVIDRMLLEARAAHRLLSEQGYHLSFPATASPFDLAQIMVGEAFLVSMLAEPDLAHEFLANLTELAIGVTRLVKREIGQADREYITNRGLFLPGYRLPCDAIVNYSPEMIRQFVLPVLERIADAFGKMCIHFCTEPAPSGHVLPTLLESDAIIAVDNWQGPDVFLAPEVTAVFRGQVSVISSVDLSSAESIDAFLGRKDVSDLRVRRACRFILATDVENVDHGKRLYEQWQEKANRSMAES